MMSSVTPVVIVCVALGRAAQITGDDYLQGFFQISSAIYVIDEKVSLTRPAEPMGCYP